VLTYLVVAVRRFYFADDRRSGMRSVGIATARRYLVNSAFITVTQLVGSALAIWSL
jgi:hypothetical protein